MLDYVAYGFANTNRSNTIVENTLAYKQLKTFPGTADKTVRIVVDVHWHSEKRPELEKLISTLDKDSIIYMYSVDTLLKGKNKGVEYYKQILNKGIQLLVLDHSGDLLKSSPISTIRLGGYGQIELTDKRKSELVRIMENIAKEYVYTPMTGKTTYKANITKEFRELYFMYEAYRITENMLMKLLPEKLGMSNKQTFISLCREYEKSIQYLEDFERYCDCDDRFLKLPKRTGKLPKEYDEIISLSKEQDGNTEKERIQTALNELEIFSNAGVIIRWKLAKEKVPKPRKPDGREVNIRFYD